MLKLEITTAAKTKESYEVQSWAEGMQLANTLDNKIISARLLLPNTEHQPLHKSIISGKWEI